MQESVLDKIKSEKLKVYVVWTTVLGGDNREAAERATKKIPDKRAVHFWDDDQSLGLIYGKIVELPRNRKLAWDIYFLYGSETVWKKVPPKPADWMHQLGNDEKLLNGEKLQEMVQKQLKDVK